MSLGQVQHWILSTLVVSLIWHLAGAVVVSAVFLSEDRASAQAVLLGIAAVIGVLGVAGGLGIHRRSPVSGWLVLGLIPAAVGAWWIFVR